MRKIYYSVIILFALIISINPAQAQLFEDFESGEKLGYAGGTADLETGTWYLEDALIRSDGNGDLKNGFYSVRIRDGFLRMEFNKTDGANELTFLSGNSDFSGDGGGVIQVHYSTDDGGSWTALGDPVTLTNSLDSYTFPVEVQGNIRFRINKTDGGRINIDDLRITDFITPEENATINVFVDGQEVSNEGVIQFPSTSSNSQREKVVTIKNRGEEILELASVTSQGVEFSVSDLADSSLAFNENTELTLTFSPDSEGPFQGMLEITSNAANAATFSLNLSGEGFADGDAISIAEARELPYETRVTVAGRVTVANEFGGPVHIQDGTGAIPVYYSPLHSEVEIGDSVQISGPLYYPPYASDNPDEFSIQITTTPNDNDVSFEIFDVESKQLKPTQITIQQLNSGEFESQLVLITNINVDHTGSLQGESSYDISDQSGTSVLRIDGDTDIAGATLPDGPINIVGVIDKFAGDYQLKPRFTDDLGVEEIIYPGEDISKDETFEVVTWNIEWFGSSSNGPEDLDTQFNNAITVINEIDADLYAFQEIANTTRFATLIDSLEDYGGIIASFSQTQKTAYLFKRATIDSLDSGMITDNMTTSNWANGRFPLFFQFNATINGINREIYSYNIHAKAFDDLGSYDQRANASRELKLYLDNMRRDDNVIFIGDYNDTINGSITSGEDSPYKNFLDDSEYTIITKNLEDKGLASQSVGSFIDHITITSELSDEYFEGTERVENTNYIGSYLSSTSDHYPIWTRFEFEPLVSIDDERLDQTVAFSLGQNYPNPFNPSTVISYQLAENSSVTLQVFDLLGREVATLVNGERRAAGEHQVTFEAGNLSSGVYIYRLSTGNGQHLMKKMLLVK
ncbi:MAG: DUF5689 domain-containing protein [Balneolaceae bacterium]